MSKYRYKDYVCPHCWLPITKCKCKIQSWELVMIDAPIQKAIKILNENDRKTMYCCAGHYRGSGELCEIQVMFAGVAESAPEGWEKQYERGNIYFDFRPKDKEEFKAIQEREINKLIEWGKK